MLHDKIIWHSKKSQNYRKKAKLLKKDQRLSRIFWVGKLLIGEVEGIFKGSKTIVCDTVIMDIEL